MECVRTILRECVQSEDPTLYTTASGVAALGALRASTLPPRTPTSATLDMDAVMETLMAMALDDVMRGGTISLPCVEPGHDMYKGIEEARANLELLKAQVAAASMGAPALGAPVASMRARQPELGPVGTPGVNVAEGHGLFSAALLTRQGIAKNP